jgi:hypothetical protein
MKNTILLAVIGLMSVVRVEPAMCSDSIYDDFSATRIDGGKWRQREYVREIVDGKMVSKLGNRSPGMGAESYPGLFRNPFDLSDPGSVNTIACDVTIVAAELDSAANARSFARLAGQFYNSYDAGGEAGDIFFEIMIGERGGDGLEAFWEVSQALSEDGEEWTEIASGTLVGPGSLAYDTPYTVKLAYDGDRAITFSVGQASGSYIGPERKRAVVHDYKGLATCIDAIGGANNGFVHAEFDNVRINDQAEVYDDFSAAFIDTAKWQNHEWVREIASGRLRTDIIGDGSTRSATTYLADHDAAYLQARVRIDSGTQLSDGARAIARLQGYYYNDSRGSGSGREHNRYEGDVFAQVRLRYQSEGDLTASAHVHRSDAWDESAFTELFAHDFGETIRLDTFYALSIHFENGKLIFGCGAETAEYSIGTPIYPAYGEHRGLRSRVALDSGESGTSRACFDDVRTAPLPDGWVTVNGTVFHDDLPVCAMVLANGQYLFTCQAGDALGLYRLDVPIDSHGRITVQAFAAGLAPFRSTVEPSDLDLDIHMQPTQPQSVTPNVTTAVSSDAATPSGWAGISGTVDAAGEPLCALVLANGQYMFSCGASSGIYDLIAPLDGNGKITLHVFASGFQPYKQVLSP